MTIKIDFKSLLIGFLGAALVFTMLSFSQSEAETESPNRYQAVASERGFIILDTQTGEYILDSEVNYIGKMQWIKGDFKEAYRKGKNKF